MQFLWLNDRQPFGKANTCKNIVYIKIKINFKSEQLNQSGFNSLVSIRIWNHCFTLVSGVWNKDINTQTKKHMQTSFPANWLFCRFLQTEWSPTNKTYLKRYLANLHFYTVRNKPKISKMSFFLHWKLCVLWHLCPLRSWICMNALWALKYMRPILISI